MGPRVKSKSRRQGAAKPLMLEERCKRLTAKAWPDLDGIYGEKYG